MSLRPCLRCGVPVAGTHCSDCQPTDVRVRHAIRSNPAAWKALSKRVRRVQPWCLDCGTTDDLCADHIIPLAVAEELALVEQNVTVRCRTCNGRRADQYTAADAQGVLDALRRAFNRRPTRAGRERIAVAERALAEVGGTAEGARVPPVGKAQRAMNSANALHHNGLRNPISSNVESSSGTGALGGDCEVPCEVG